MRKLMEEGNKMSETIMQMKERTICSCSDTVVTTMAVWKKKFNDV